MTLRVLLADDHRIFRQGLHALLSSAEELTVIAEANDGAEAMTAIRAHRPDVAVLDLSMPVATGIEVTAAALAEGLRTRVVLLTMYKDPDLLHRALEAGVYGYVLKESAFEELVYAIRQANIGGVFVSPQLLSRTRRGEPNPVLTPREREILCFVAQGRTSRQIAAALHISLKTVESHRRNIMQKLDVANSAEMVRTAVERGLVPRG